MTITKEHLLKRKVELLEQKNLGQPLSEQMYYELNARINEIESLINHLEKK